MRLGVHLGPLYLSGGSRRRPGPSYFWRAVGVLLAVGICIAYPLVGIIVGALLLGLAVVWFLRRIGKLPTTTRGRVR